MAVYVKKSFDKKIDGKNLFKGSEGELRYGVNAFQTIQAAIDAGEEIVALDTNVTVGAIDEAVELTTQYNNEKESETEKYWYKLNEAAKNSLTVKGASANLDVEYFKNVTLGKGASIQSAMSGTNKVTQDGLEGDPKYTENQTQTSGGNFVAVDAAVGEGISGFSKVTVVDTVFGGDMVAGKGSNFTQNIIKEDVYDRSVSKLANTLQGTVSVLLTKDHDGTQVASNVERFKKVEIIGFEAKNPADTDQFAVVDNIIGGNSTQSSDDYYYEDGWKFKHTDKTTVDGSVELDYATVNEDIDGYKKVIVVDSTVGGDIIGGNTAGQGQGRFTDDGDIVDAVHKFIAAGSADIEGELSTVGTVKSFQKVTVSNGAQVGTAVSGNEVYGWDEVAGEGFYTTEFTAAGSIVVKDDKKYEASEDAAATYGGNISGFSKVTVAGRNQKGRVSFVKAGNIVGGNIEAIESIADGDVVTEASAAGSASVSFANVSNITNFKTVTIQNGSADTVGTDAEAFANLFFQNSQLSFITIPTADEIDFEIKGTSLVMKNALVETIDNVAKVKVQKGVSALGASYVNDSGEETQIAIDSNAALVLKTGIDFQEAVDYDLVINGSLIFEAEDADVAAILGGASSITGKGEIAVANALVETVKGLDITDKIDIVDTGATALGFTGSKFEAADNTAKKAVEVDLDFLADATTDPWTGWLNGDAEGADVVDAADYIKFTLNLAEDETANMAFVGGNEAFLDGDVLYINNNRYVYDEEAASFVMKKKGGVEEDFTAFEFKDGQYIVGIELDNAAHREAENGSFSYAISFS